MNRWRSVWVLGIFFFAIMLVLHLNETAALIRAGASRSRVVPSIMASLGMLSSCIVCILYARALKRKK